MGATRSSAFGTLLRRYREQAGLSQERLAERAGLSLRGISDLERGARTTPRLETVRMLAEGLGLGASGTAALLAARAGDMPVMTEPVFMNLPTPATPFIGREDELERIIDMLQRDDTRLVTLVGPGGVGKTRLALEVARRLSTEFPDGAVFIDLEPVRDPGLVLPAIASRLGVQDSAGQVLIDVIGIALRDRDLLIILDNMEQVVDASPDIAALLTTCPSLKVLATSRIVLRITAERVLPVSPLQVPDAVPHPPSLQDLAYNESVALFVDRARAADPTFTLSDANSDAVAALVNRLDGLPLAIELAAARTRTLPPETLLARLERRLQLLTRGARDAPERQRTMRGAIAWSYDILTPTQQAMFRRLSIFVGGCTFEASRSVIATDGDVSDVEIMEELEALVDSSLLRRRHPDNAEPRYVMLQTVREFGLEQLEAHDEEDAVRDAAHRGWYAGLAKDGDFLMSWPHQIEWLDRLEAEHENLRSDISWLIAKGRIDDALDISGSLWFFRWIRGYYAEARQQYEELVADPRGEARTVIRGNALIGLGVIAAHQGDTERSMEVLQEAVNIFRDVGEQRHLSLALLCQGTTHLFVGQFDESEILINECRAVAMAIGDEMLVSAALCNLGNIASSRGQWERARERMEASVRIARSIGNTWGLALGLLNLGSYYMREGKLEQAEEHVRDATTLIGQLGDLRDLPGAFWMLAEIARIRGDLLEATSLLERALHTARVIGDFQMIAVCLSGLAQLLHLKGDEDRALDLARECIRLFIQGGDLVGAAMALDAIAEIATAMGDPAHAAWCIGAVDGVLQRQHLPRHESAPGEHQARVDAVVAALGEPAYRKHWTRGHVLSTDAVLADALAWSPSGNSAAMPKVQDPESRRDSSVTLSPS